MQSSIQSIKSLNIKFAKTPKNTNKRMLYSRLKDKVGLESKKYAVFKIQCRTCRFTETHRTNNLDLKRTFHAILNRRDSGISIHISENPTHRICNIPVQVKSMTSKNNTSLAMKVLHNKRRKLSLPPPLEFHDQPQN